MLDGVLAKREWLVGGKCTIADLSFVPWNRIAFSVIMQGFEGFDAEKQYPAFYA